MSEKEEIYFIFQRCSAMLHDLNQPLTALLGSIELMKLTKHEPEKMARHMDRAEESGRALFGLVREMQELFNNNLRNKPNLHEKEDKGPYS